MKFRARSLTLALTLGLGAIACGGDPAADDSEKIVENTEQERSEEIAIESDDDDSAPPKTHAKTTLPASQTTTNKPIGQSSFTS